MAQIGVNAWVWTSPVTTEAFAKLAPRVKEMGFDLIEFGVEGTSDLDYKRASEIARDLGLGASVCAAMGPDRDLIHPDESIRKSSAEYVRHCVTRGFRGAPDRSGYSSVGRCCADATSARRPGRTDALKALSKYDGDRGVALCGALTGSKRAPEPGEQRSRSSTGRSRRAGSCSTVHMKSRRKRWDAIAPPVRGCVIAHVRNDAARRGRTCPGTKWRSLPRHTHRGR